MRPQGTVVKYTTFSSHTQLAAVFLKPPYWLTYLVPRIGGAWRSSPGSWRHCVRSPDEVQVFLLRVGDFTGKIYGVYFGSKYCTWVWCWITVDLCSEDLSFFFVVGGVLRVEKRTSFSFSLFSLPPYRP